MNRSYKADWRRRAEAAEKTVDVLKTKVRKMYQEGVQSSIHRQLERSRQREEANRQRRAMIELRARELSRYNEHLEIEVEQRTRALQTILDNVTFGFFVIGQDTRVREGFTRSCERLFGRQFQAGAQLSELLQLGSHESFELLLGVEQVYEDILPEELTLAQLPSRFELNDKILRMEGRVIRDERGEVEALLMTLSDITALEEARGASRRNEILVGILKSKRAFEEFVIETRLQLQLSRRCLEQQRLVRHAVHTLKGNAASYGLDDVVAQAHKVEMNDEISGADLDSLEDLMRAFFRDNQAILGLDYDELQSHSFEVTEEQVQQLKQLLEQSDNRAQLRDWAALLVQCPARELIGPLPSFVEKLSKRLDKEVDFHFVGEDIIVDSEAMRPIFQSLPHLIRNALDHGIEAPHLRGDKPKRGKICVRLSEFPERYLLEVEDDGRGIKLDSLSSRAVCMGLETPRSLASMSNEDKVQLIFCHGLSSSEITTDISGRGIGMPAVLGAVKQQGGRIEVDTSARGTSIKLNIPKSNVFIPICESEVQKEAR